MISWGEKEFLSQEDHIYVRLHDSRASFAVCLRHAWHICICTYLVYPVDGKPHTQLFFIARPGLPSQRRTSIAVAASVAKWRWRVARGNDGDSSTASPRSSRSGARSGGGVVVVVARHRTRIWMIACTPLTSRRGKRGTRVSRERGRRLLASSRVTRTTERKCTRCRHSAID